MKFNFGKYLTLLAALLALADNVSSERLVITYKANTRSKVLAELISQGWELAIDIPEGNAIVVTRTDSLASDARSAVLSELTSMPEIDSAEPDGQLHLHSCNGPNVDQAKTAIDGQTEVWPWGISMVQADDLTFLNGGAAKRNNVIYCVLDTGLDKTHPDLAASGNIIKGCSPPKCSYAWDKDALGHGTHTTGTIAARRNGAGVVGVHNTGAHIYVVNLFGDAGVMDESELVPAWNACLDYLKLQQKKNANTKMVVSMSIGGPGPGSGAIAAKLDALYARGDMLFLSAAGNGIGTTVAYPAGYKNVISVAAVDPNNKVPDWSQKNSDVEVAAPGTDILSTVPSAKATYFLADDLLTLSPRLAEAGPAPAVVQNSRSGSVSGNVVDCGSAFEPCAGASGAICFVTREDDTCAQVNNCKAGGGVGIIFADWDTESCGAMADVNMQGCSIMPAAAISGVQGDSLRAALSAGQTQASISGGSAKLGYMYKSGTSMATPHASGVAGLVWSFYPKCSNAEIRNALWQTGRSAGAKTAGGYGLVQAKAAYDYLKTHPCKGLSKRKTKPKRKGRKLML